MKRSKFSLSNYKLLTCDMGELVPIGMIDVLPGDSIQQSSNLLLRCSPLLAPVMHPVHVRVHHWFVPYRIIWDDFEKFITGGPDGMDASVVPYSGTSGVAVGSLADYFGIPVSTAITKYSMLPFRAYVKIWNEFYRDQDLQAEAPLSTASGSDGTTSKSMQYIGWEKDYFTSSRPWEQKGPAITVPIGTSAPVEFRELGATPGLRTLDRTAASTPSDMRVVGAGTAAATIQATANLASASAVTVNILREAMALQRYEEARARYGSRYTEYLRYLGVRSSDARLQRPEYLGGGKQTIQFSEVLQTAPDGATSVVGEMKGHGLAAMRSNRYRRFFEEHGVVLSLLSVRPKTMYSQGLHRMWSKFTKEDYWQRELQHIGQQEVLNKEVYAKHTTPDGVFGFQDRYDEYRRSESSVAGDFQTTLNHWHFAREFAADPALNSSFVRSVPTERPFAVSTNDVLWIMANHSIQARRMVAPSGNSYIF